MISQNSFIFFTNQYKICICETVCQAAWTMAKWTYPEFEECALFMVKHLKSDNWFSPNVSGICQGNFEDILEDFVLKLQCVSNV